MGQSASAPGKIILCGEYAVVFGHPGIAVPAPFRVEVTYEPTGSEWLIECEGICGDDAKRDAYIHTILQACAEQAAITPGTIRITNAIPLGKGMGSSTALTIAITRCVLGSAAESHGFPLREKILAVENIVNPGVSGIDFAVIWAERPVYFKKGQTPTKPELPEKTLKALKHAVLIDTGAPNEATPELVTWMTMRHVQGDPSVERAIHAIGDCAARLLGGEDILSVIRDHHRAQVELGIVNAETQNLIKKIEQEGGAAKVIGAGGRTGGSGIVLAFHADGTLIEAVAKQEGFSMLQSP